MNTPGPLAQQAIHYTIHRPIDAPTNTINQPPNQLTIWGTIHLPVIGLAAVATVGDVAPAYHLAILDVTSNTHEQTANTAKAPHSGAKTARGHPRFRGQLGLLKQPYPGEKINKLNILSHVPQCQGMALPPKAGQDGPSPPSSSPTAQPLPTLTHTLPKTVRVHVTPHKPHPPPSPGPRCRPGAGRRRTTPWLGSPSPSAAGLGPVRRGGTVGR